MENRKKQQQMSREENFQGNVFVSKGDDSSHSRPSNHYIGKAIISIQDGRKIGSVSDIAVNRDNLQVAAVVTSKGNIFNREVEAILAEEIRVWGEDVLLVNTGWYSSPRAPNSRA
jgi:uncharacterized protein YrrD